jgi:hypothetical protein
MKTALFGGPSPPYNFVAMSVTAEKKAREMPITRSAKTTNSNMEKEIAIIWSI